MADKAQEAGRRADHSQALEAGIRFGHVVYGVVHLTFAWLALQLALGDSSGEASGSGAVQELAGQPLGEIVLWSIAVGMALLVLWRLLDAVRGHWGDDGATLWRKRAADVVMAGVYATLAYTAVSTVIGASSGSGEQTSRSVTARVMELPGGQVLVGAVGVVVIALAGALAWRGVTRSFMERFDADGRQGQDSRAYRVLGTVGYVAKGGTLAIVGALFVVSAARHQPSQTGGTDTALRELLDQPFGPYLLGAMAVGIGAYGLFCFARARHLSR
ncbi:DUF1206 domain-containing protein [Aeromicrobium halocynthiae]|uniref:DUF1206 domain-containing protein n=1 Tax=Aeromicrobium halocynthiae TaxID=560557 RepID=A0ABN2VZ56_9ACTN